MYALFYGGKQVSKGHSTVTAAIIESYEREAVIRVRGGVWLAEKWEIKDVNDEGCCGSQQGGAGCPV